VSPLPCRLLQRILHLRHHKFSFQLHLPVLFILALHRSLRIMVHIKRFTYVRVLAIYWCLGMSDFIDTMG
jgi:hypothetical protein